MNKEERKIEQGKVAKLATKYEVMSGRPPLPPKTFKIINGKNVLISPNVPDDISNADTSSVDSDGDTTSKIGCKSNDNDKEESQSKSNQSKPDLISKECTDFINLVYNSLEHIIEFRKELIKEFEEFSDDIIRRLQLVFKDVDTLYSLYKLIRSKINKLTNGAENPLELASLFVDPEVAALLKMYKPFLTTYADNAKWLGELQRSQSTTFNNACDRAKDINKIDAMISLDTCFYTIFNSLFSYELFLSRYWKAFPEEAEEHKRADDAKKVLSKLLSEVNTSQDKENFMNTQKELNLMTGRTREPKINTRFIIKIDVKKVSRRDGRLLNRQLVMFTDCLYVTMAPNALTGQSNVRQEMSLEHMKLTTNEADHNMDVITQNTHDEAVRATGNDVVDKDNSDTDDTISHKDAVDDIDNYGGEDNANNEINYILNISSREADQDFIFPDEETRTLWKNKLTYYASLLKETCNNITNTTPPVEDDNSLTSFLKNLGKKSPRWQLDGSANICNGYRCYKEFSNTIRRHHCRADGLLYCEQCCNWRMTLEFERKEARVCELCYNILEVYKGKNSSQLKDSQDKLEIVFNRRTRFGRMKGWITCYELNKNTGQIKYGSALKYYAVLEPDTPFINLYTKIENKANQKGIMLTGMQLCSKPIGRCVYHPPLKENFISLEHVDRYQIYFFKLKTPQLCAEWKMRIKEALDEHLNNDES